MSGHSKHGTKVPRHDKLIIAMTFVLAMLAGSYLYIVGFAPNYTVDSLPLEHDAEDLVIFAETYGGMRFGEAPKFEITGDGSYSYTPFNENAGEAIATVDGQLPDLLREELYKNLTPSGLKEAAREITPETCAMFVDGVEYRYRIALKDETYTLDTCGTDFSNDSEMGQTLSKIWEYLELNTESEEI